MAHTQEKMLNITDRRGNANQNPNDASPRARQAGAEGPPRSGSQLPYDGQLTFRRVSTNVEDTHTDAVSVTASPTADRYGSDVSVRQLTDEETWYLVTPKPQPNHRTTTPESHR